MPATTGLSVCSGCGHSTGCSTLKAAGSPIRASRPRFDHHRSLSVGFPWAHFRTTKAAVKMHILLDLRGSIASFFHDSDGKLHDVHALDLLTPEAGAIYDMDRGVGLCVGGYCSEKTESQRFPLHFATGFIAHPVREDDLAASVSGQRLQFGKPGYLQPTESIQYLTWLQ